MEVTLTAVAVVSHPLKSCPYLTESEGRHRSANGPRIDSDMVFLFEKRKKWPMDVGDFCHPTAHYKGQ